MVNVRVCITEFNIRMNNKNNTDTNNNNVLGVELTTGCQKTTTYFHCNNFV